MHKFIYQSHLILGIFVSIPILAWALSGLLYAMSNMVDGGTVEKIDPSRVRVLPGYAMSKANEIAGRQLPTTHSRY